jgi:hypothetical protein
MKFLDYGRVNAIRNPQNFVNSRSQPLGRMVYFPLFSISGKSVFEPMYLAGSEGFVTISVLKVDFEPNTIISALKVLLCSTFVLVFHSSNQTYQVLRQTIRQS